MKFTDLDAWVRVFEIANDHCVLPGMRIVVRLDGRGFTRLTPDLELPMGDDHGACVLARLPE